MMAKLVLMMGMSLDGMVARPGKYGAGGWGTPPEDPALTERKLGWLGEAGMHLMGRVTYEEMAGFWPTSDDAYAAPMNDLPKVVFSGTLTKADWPRSTIARGDLAEEVTALKRQPGRDMIAWGGAAFAQSLSRHRLVDEYRLVVQPVALGEGLPLFDGLTAPFVLDLIEARAYGDGAVLHIYRPAQQHLESGAALTVAAAPTVGSVTNTRERLLGERARAQRLAASLDREFADIAEAASAPGTDDEHDPEGATLAFERQHTAALLARARDQIAQIDAALGRLDDGTYGTCARCGQPIGEERLAARPAVATCVRCAAR